MTEKEQSILRLFVELQQLYNSGVVDMLTAAVTRLNECGKEVEQKNDAIREVLRPVYYNKTTREFAMKIGKNPDYLPTSFIQTIGELVQLKEQLQRLLTAYKDVMPTANKDTFEDVLIENYTEKED